MGMGNIWQIKWTTFMSSHVKIPIDNRMKLKKKKMELFLFTSIYTEESFEMQLMIDE